MNLTPYVEALGQQLAESARAVGGETAAAAERLGPPLEVASRLVLQDAVADAAAEISRELAPGSVDVRLRSRELTFVVDRGPQDHADATAATVAKVATEPATAAGEPPSDAAGEGGTARLTVRMPEPLKASLEAAADQQGLSLNAYLVRTLTAAAQGGAMPGTATSTPLDTGNQLSGWVQ